MYRVIASIVIVVTVLLVWFLNQETAPTAHRQEEGIHINTGG